MLALFVLLLINYGNVIEMLAKPLTISYIIALTSSLINSSKNILTFSNEIAFLLVGSKCDINYFSISGVGWHLRSFKNL